MTARTPVVLISLPNLPYLIGTFDTTNFRQWWRSKPFPEQILSIKKGMHIYGRSHLAISQRVDGLWAVYRSNNYGIDWERVWLASSGEVIYDILLIDFGWAIMNTSAGFYETVNTGTSWAKVADLPSASSVPAFCNIGGGDVLLCTDGRYIWRSTDVARHWTLVCDQRALLRYAPWGSGYQRITYTGLTSPCIAGANGYVVCGFGPHITISEDAGETWTQENHEWEICWPGYFEFVYPNPNLIWYRFVPVEPPQFIVKQILVASVDGLSIRDVTFLLKYDDLYPVPGDSKLYSRTFKSFSYTTRSGAPVIGWRCMFQQYISPVEGSQLAAYDLPVTGETYNDRLAFSAQTRVDSAGNQVPSLKYSIDGGSTWIDIDLNNIQVGNPDGSPVYGGSSLDDNFANITWVHGLCENSWQWKASGQYRKQNLSQEIDFLIATRKQELDSVQYNIDAIIHEIKTKPQQLDTLLSGKRDATARIDGLFEGRNTKSHRLDILAEGSTTRQYWCDIINAADHSSNLQVAIKLWGQFQKLYHLDAVLRGKNGTSSRIDMILIRYNLNKRLSEVENINPQIFDIDVPFIPTAPYNSQQETL